MLSHMVQIIENLVQSDGKLRGKYIKENSHSRAFAITEGRMPKRL